MNRLLACSLGLLALNAGCNEGKPPTPGASSAAVRSATPKTTSSAAAKPRPNPIEREDFGFFSVVAIGEDMTIYPMGESAIVDTGAFYAVLGDGALSQDPELFRSSFEKEPGKVVITPAARLGGFFGAHPTQAWATGEAGLMKLVNDLWVKQDFLRDGEKLLDLTPWEKGRAIAAIRMAQADIRFTLVGSAAGGVVPAPGKPTAAQTGCAVRMDPDAPVKLAGVASGHLFAVGKECKTGKFVAERWAPSKARGDADVLEGVSGSLVAVSAVSADEAYALFDDGVAGMMAAWDGKAWKVEKSPVGTPKSMWLSGDNKVWAIGGKGLYEHPRRGAWEEVGIGNGKPTSSWSKDSKTVWIVSDKKVLLRSGPRMKRLLRLPPASEVQATLARDRRWLATDVCKRVYVQLAAIGPADNVPTTFAALNQSVKDRPELVAKEIQYLVEDVGGTLHAGAKVPTLVIADKLVAAFRAKQPDSKPIIFCHEPVVKGPLKIE